MQINYQAMTLRPGHCAITNQGKGSGFVSSVDLSHLTKKEKKSEIKVYIFYILKL